MTDAAKEMLELADEIEQNTDSGGVVLSEAESATVVSIIRSAASAPSQGGEIERETIERCVDITSRALAEHGRLSFVQVHGWSGLIEKVEQAIRALSVTGEAREGEP